MNDFRTLTPQQAWEKIKSYRENNYDSLAALYSGDEEQLKLTAEPGSFWQRKNGTCRIHVPLASDIAATSANLMFSMEPTYVVVHGGKEDSESKGQKRLEELIAKNLVASKLNEGAETCAALGDVYLKLRWNSKINYPLLDVVQPDQAWPEYLLGECRCIHFFTIIASDADRDRYVRAYECYSRGKIITKLFDGKFGDLGIEMSKEATQEFGFEPETNPPIDDLLAVHIPNIRPNRKYRSSMFGRSDLDGLRDMFDSLDETYTSWMRDIRLAKARMIVPAEYLRKHKVPEGMEQALESYGTWEFDADVEAYVAMDINTDGLTNNGITLSQFDIRAQEHSFTCIQTIQSILQYAGYSPNSFGMNTEGAAASGYALKVRERKSAITKNKKLTYWQSPLEQILTSMIHLDHALYPQAGSDSADTVSVAFADTMGADATMLAETVQMLHTAQSASVRTRVRMMHPDWGEQQVNEEVDTIKKEYLIEGESPDMMIGDNEKPNKNNPDDKTPDGENDEGGDEVNE